MVRDTRNPSQDNSSQDGRHSVDIHVGARMRLRRSLLSISQEELGRRLGITFQQVQKYENAANRISASRLYDVASALDVPINYFFDDMGEDYVPPPPVSADQPDHQISGLLNSPETRELVELYYAIPAQSLRKALRGLIEEAALHFEPVALAE